jgi:hypothetical protein
MDPRCANNPWCGDMDSGCGQTEPVVLTARRPRFIVNYDQPGMTHLGREYNDVEIDVLANTLSFPVEVVTTLGFSSSTYVACSGHNDCFRHARVGMGIEAIRASQKAPGRSRASARL